MDGDSEIFMKPTRRCKVCGRLLFSAEALKTGYGCQCAKKAKREEEERQPIPGQMNLMDWLKTESEETEDDKKQDRVD